MGRFAVAAAVAAWAIPISILVGRIVPDPYMDEIFHIPQAQHYCRGDFRTWDPMITTPPGLYYLSLVYVVSLFPNSWLGSSRSLSEICTCNILRSTNCVLAIICGVLVYDLFIHLKPTLSEKKATSYAVFMALYPVHWFFTFLYYTDVASLTAVLAMYLACLKRNYFISAMLGVIATLIRQTNIIWMMFVAFNAAISYTDILSNGSNYIIGKNDDLSVEMNSTSAAPSNLKKRRMGSCTNTIKSVTDTNVNSPRKNLGLVHEILDVCPKLWIFKWKVLAMLSPFILLLIVFVLFIFLNGSIVLGAKDAHVVSPHFAQMMYVGLVCSAALAPLFLDLSQLSSISRRFRKHKAIQFTQLFVALIIGLTSVHFFSIVHPYLLADNRHYTFYFWRKIIQAHWTAAYLLVPLYIYSWFWMIGVLGKSQKRIWVLSFVLATALALVPAPLIEFRYYTVPFYLFTLHALSGVRHSTTKVLLTGILYISIDLITMTMFLFRPFHWDHEPGIQRFIW